MTPMSKAAKRVMDVLISVLGLIVFTPVIFVVALLIFMSMGRPVLFTQERPGKDGRIFRLIKFRTMTDERNAEGNLLPDEQRLTRLGRFCALPAWTSFRSFSTFSKET